VAETTTYKGMTLPSTTPTGTAGLAIFNNFKAIRDDNPPCKVDATEAPGTADDVTEGWYVNSRWVDVSAGDVWTCVDNTTNAAEWVRCAKLTGTAGDLTGYSIVVQTGDDATLNATTPDAGELIFKTTTQRLAVGNGSAAGGINVVHGYKRGTAALTYGGTVAVDASAGDVLLLTLTGTAHLTDAINVADDYKAILAVKQGTAGGFTVGFANGYSAGDISDTAAGTTASEVTYYGLAKNPFASGLSIVAVAKGY